MGRLPRLPVPLSLHPDAHLLPLPVEVLYYLTRCTLAATFRGILSHSCRVEQALFTTLSPYKRAGLSGPGISRIWTISQNRRNSMDLRVLHRVERCLFFLLFCEIYFWFDTLASSRYKCEEKNVWIGTDFPLWERRCEIQKMQTWLPARKEDKIVLRKHNFSVGNNWTFGLLLEWEYFFCGSTCLQMKFTNGTKIWTNHWNVLLAKSCWKSCGQIRHHLTLKIFPWCACCHWGKCT